MRHHQPPPAGLLPHLRRARDLMDRAYGDRLDLQTIARAARCSPYHLLRSFRSAYGETPGRYLARRRVERAKDLLRSTNLTVTEICHLVGYSSLGTFSARFSELVGVSPTAYREESVRRGGTPPIPGCFVFMYTRPMPSERNFEEASPPPSPLASQQVNPTEEER